MSAQNGLDSYQGNQDVISYPSQPSSPPTDAGSAGYQSESPLSMLHHDLNVGQPTFDGSQGMNLNQPTYDNGSTSQGLNLQPIGNTDQDLNLNQPS